MLARMAQIFAAVDDDREALRNLDVELKKVVFGQARRSSSHPR